MLKLALFLTLSLLLISPSSVLAYGANTLDNTTITITQSLNYDAKKANISPKIVKTLIRIFSWEIDFNKDLRKGDRFIIVGKHGVNPSALIYIGATKSTALCGRQVFKMG